MRKMLIKTHIIAFVILLSGLTYAQESPIKFGVKAGMNLSNLSGDTENPQSKIGYQIGITLDYKLTDNFFLHSGVDYTNKGYKEKAETITEVEEGMEITVSNARLTIDANYLQLPIHIGYVAYRSNSTNIYFTTGPYIAFGVGGKTKITGLASIPEYDLRNEFFSTKVNTFRKGMLKDLDLGFGAGIGVEYNKLDFKIGYDFGLINIYSPLENEDQSLKNGNAYLTIGYKF